MTKKKEEPKEAPTTARDALKALEAEAERLEWQHLAAETRLAEAKEERRQAVLAQEAPARIRTLRTAANEALCDVEDIGVLLADLAEKIGSARLLADQEARIETDEALRGLEGDLDRQIDGPLQVAAEAFAREVKIAFDIYRNHDALAVSGGGHRIRRDYVEDIVAAAILEHEVVPPHALRAPVDVLRKLGRLRVAEPEYECPADPPGDPTDVGDDEDPYQNTNEEAA